MKSYRIYIQIHKIMRLYLLLLFSVISFSSASAQTTTAPNKLDSNGKKDGLWNGFFDNSKVVKYEGTFRNGVETGVFTFYNNNPAHTVMATRDFSKQPNAAYTIFYDDLKNKVSEGNVVNKLYEGLWKYYHRNSKEIMTMENYKKGKLNGKRTVFYKDGKVAEEAVYVDGKRHGAYKKISGNGIVLEESNYQNGELHGSAVYKDPDGNVVAKGNYKNDQKFGTWQFFENGKLVSKEKYPLNGESGKPKGK